MNAIRLLRGVVLVAGCAAASLAWGAACERSTQTTANRDGSSLIVTQDECADANERRIRVAYRGGAKHKARTVLQLTQLIDETPMGNAQAIDLDGDGMFEIELRGMCGAGPNCEGSIYKLDATRRAMFAYFVGGYADLSMRDGYLIEGGRASCCSWEFHVYATQARHYPIGYDDMKYMIVAQAVVVDGKDEVDRGECTISQHIGDAWKIVPAPSPALAALCEVYGPDYTLVPPDAQP